MTLKTEHVGPLSSSSPDFLKLSSKEDISTPCDRGPMVQTFGNYSILNFSLEICNAR